MLYSISNLVLLQSNGMQSRNVSRPIAIGKKADVVMQIHPVILSIAPPRVATS